MNSYMFCRDILQQLQWLKHIVIRAGQAGMTLHNMHTFINMYVDQLLIQKHQMSSKTPDVSLCWPLGNLSWPQIPTKFQTPEEVMHLLSWLQLSLSSSSICLLCFMYNHYIIPFPDPMSRQRIFLQHEISHFYPSSWEILVFNHWTLLPLWVCTADFPNTVRQSELPPLCCLGAGLKLSWSYHAVLKLWIIYGFYLSSYWVLEAQYGVFVMNLKNAKTIVSDTQLMWKKPRRMVEKSLPIPFHRQLPWASYTVNCIVSKS